MRKIRLDKFQLAGPVVLVAVLALPAYLRADIAPAPQRAAALQGTEPAQFMRFTDEGAAGGRLETAVVSYRNDAGQTVKLVGAIHIGEHGYYESLNKDFETDDAVLYEMVKPKDAAMPKPGAAPAGGGGNPISEMQHMMKDVLNLSYQLDVIDYTKPNFVHADMDKETFEKMQEERGETFEMLVLRQIIKAYKHPEELQADKGADSKDEAEDQEKMVRTVIQLFTRPDMERQIKVMVARQLTDLQTKGKGFDVLGGSTVIVGERNKTALKVLSDTLALKRQRISVFYGAAHMPDLAVQLKSMGFKPIACEWKTAWDLRIRQDAPSAVEKLLVDLFKGLADD